MNKPARRRKAHFLWVGFLLTALGVLVAPAIALGADPVAPVAAATSHALIITPVNWTILTGLAMPLVLAVVMRFAASSYVKGAIGIVAAFVAALIERAAKLPDGTAILSSGLLLDSVMVYAPQLLTYLGFWQHLPTDTPGVHGINAKLRAKNARLDDAARA